MKLTASEILDILNDHGIVPEEGREITDLPAIGEIKEGETVYTTSIKKLTGETEDREDDFFGGDNPRIREWSSEIREIVQERGDSSIGQRMRPIVTSTSSVEEPPEPHCAWYSPIHFFGHEWGIYIREKCILSLATLIARFVDWRGGRFSASTARQLLRSAFYVFYLHEQFHHKVESFGFRILVATGSDRYRPYKTNVYRQTYLSSDCLEESLANAESYRRLGEQRYKQRIDKWVRMGVRDFHKKSMPMQPQGYAQGVDYFPEKRYREGLYRLQSQLLDGAVRPTSPPEHWSLAPNMITSLADIDDDIYVVLPSNARPIFSPTSVDPGATVSSRKLQASLTKHYGYEVVRRGGKGSHVKLEKRGAPPIIMPGNRSVLSPGFVKHVLNAVGGYPISRLPELLSGGLTAKN